MWIAVLLSLFAQSATWQDWYAVGPIPIAADTSLTAALDTAQDPETLLPRLRRGAELSPRGRITLASGDKLSWRRLARPSHPLLLSRVMPSKSRAVGYLFRNFNFEGSGRLPMEISAAGVYRVWLNGEVVEENRKATTLAGSLREIQLPAKKGNNSLLIKVVGDPGAWAFGLRTSFRWEKEVASMQPQIHSAIENGVSWLLSRQLVDGSWEAHSKEGYPTGITPVVLYTLLKCGLGTDHPAVQRALLHLRRHEFKRTYSTSFLLLALAATDDQQYRPWAQELSDWLIRTLPPQGVYGYPGSPDISNHVIAVLGLNAATKTFGIKVPPKVWDKILEGTLDYRALEERVVLPTGSSVYERGFTYRKGEASGSMTTGGITSVYLALENLGSKASPRLQKQCDTAIQEALVWLGNHWSVSNNPPNRSWHYFHLYGLERVGSLLQVGLMGQHPWYLEGARYLVKNQAPAGTWSMGADPLSAERDTCMGLLFLKRATSIAVTEDESEPTQAQVHTDLEGDVVLRASGDTPMTFWVSDSRAVPTRSQFFASEVGQDDDVIELGSGELLSGRPTLRYTFPRSGNWDVWCELDTPAGKLESPLLTVSVERVLTDRLLAAATHPEENLLLSSEVSWRASTQVDKWAAKDAGDGSVSSGWKAKEEDADPWIYLEFDKSVRAQSIWLTTFHARRSDHEKARAIKVRIIVNKRETFEVDLSKRALDKTEFRLPKKMKLRQLEIHILALSKGEIGQTQTGLAEIEILP